MKRILLDENIDNLLRELFGKDVEVTTVQERGWSSTKNGELLRRAEREFDVFITMDRNLEHQQNLKSFDLAIVVIRAHSNTFSAVSPLMPRVNEAVRSIQSKEIIHITTSEGATE